MRISLKKIVTDIRGLTVKHPEAYVYSIILSGSDAVAKRAAEADPSLEVKLSKYVDQTDVLLDALQSDSLDDLDKRFFLHIQKPWNMINAAAQKQPKGSRRKFLQESTSLFWSTLADSDKAAQAHSGGRLYGLFWIPFLVGATAIGGIFAYSSGKSTKEYIEEKEKSMSPILYAGIGAAVVIGLSMMSKR